MSTVWELVVSGQYEEACRIADQEFNETSSLPPLRNKVCALLRLGRHRDAAQLCHEVIRLAEGRADGDFIFLGTSEWLDGREEEAIAAWQAAIDTRYTDAAGGVEIHLLSLFASIKRSDQSLRRRLEAALKALCKRRTITNWPGPIARFVLGRFSEKELLSAISDHPILRARESCQADFYLGLLRLAEGDRQGYAESMVRSCSHGPVCLVDCEFYIAEAEVRGIALRREQ